MDQIYNNKKYLQTVNAADYYRASSLRPSVSRMDLHFQFLKKPWKVVTKFLLRIVAARVKLQTITS